MSTSSNKSPRRGENGMGKAGKIYEMVKEGERVYDIIYNTYIYIYKYI